MAGLLPKIVNGGYLELKFEPVPVTTPGYYADWATRRIELIGFENVYDKWVTNAIIPEILFDNCTEDLIKEETYFDLGNGW